MQRSQAFNMKILGYDPFLPEDFFREDELQICDLDYLIENSDRAIISDLDKPTNLLIELETLLF